MSPAATSVTKLRAALLVRLSAKSGKEAAVAGLLQEALSFVEQEPETITWYAIRLGPSTFGIFDTFPDEDGRRAHLAGRVAVALRAHVPDLLESAPTVERAEILFSKLPGSRRC
jgi:quinol monooxygenase YgiN